MFFHRWAAFFKKKGQNSPQGRVTWSVKQRTSLYFDMCCFTEWTHCWFYILIWEIRKWDLCRLLDKPKKINPKRYLLWNKYARVIVIGFIWTLEISVLVPRLCLSSRKLCKRKNLVWHIRRIASTLLGVFTSFSGLLGFLCVGERLFQACRMFVLT